MLRSVGRLRDRSASVSLPHPDLTSGEAKRMRNVMIRCPSTGTPVSTNVVVQDDASYASLPVEEAVLRDCPACGDTHVWDKRESFLD